MPFFWMVAERIPTVKILSIVVLLFLAVIAYGMTAQPVTAQQQHFVASSNASTMTVASSPTITAHFIDIVLCTAHSPACGTGQSLYNDGVQFGIDPVFALAFFKHESSYGKYGIAHDNLGLGNIRCSDGYQCKHGFRAYLSWQAGYLDWFQLIRYYVDTWHKSTVDAIVPTYAPSTENDTQGYISAIETAVQEWRSEVVR